MPIKGDEKKTELNSTLKEGKRIKYTDERKENTTTTK